MSNARRPGTLPLAFLADANPETKTRLGDLLRRAGIRMRTERGRLAFRSDTAPPPMVASKPLQRKDDGALRYDAAKTLEEGVLLEDRVSETSDWFRTRYKDFLPGAEGKAKRIVPTSFDAFQLDLLWNPDPVPIVQKWTQQEWEAQVRLHRLITTRALHLRDYFWRLASAHLAEGISLQKIVSEGRWPKLGQISGTVVVHSAIWVVATMTARVQPFAAAFTTAGGAEVVAIPQGAWDRDPYQPLMWPVGFGSLRLSGSGVGAYAQEGNEGKIPNSVAADLFNEQISGVNKLLLALTDPGAWVTDTGELDVEERAIAWSTINLGVAAVKDIAQSWGADASIWAAFRALGILAGYWTPPGGSDVPIARFVTPSTVEDFAASKIKPEWLRDWSRNVVSNWEVVLSETFPGSSPDQAAKAIQELRNLVHGVGVGAPRTTRPRDSRLLALAATGETNLQLVQDIAVMWWTALLQNPRTHAQSGRPPF